MMVERWTVDQGASSRRRKRRQMSLMGSVLLGATAPGAVKRFDHVSRDPIGSQHRLLRAILGTNADSTYGRRHGFGGITSFQQFQERVPIASYEDLEPYIKAAMAGEPTSSPSMRPCCLRPPAGRPGRASTFP
jgi:hypothetical protein